MTPIEMISVPLLRVAASPRPDAELAPWVEPLKAACVKAEINTIRRIAAFLANIAVESDFRPRQENLNYSVEGLTATFGRHRITVGQCQQFGRTPTRKADQEAIANCIYGGDWGRVNLGNVQSGDGWTFRGVGPLQVTGRGNMQRFAAWIGRPLDEALAYARTLEGGIMTAAWFWEAHDVNRLADTPGVVDEVHAINGGENGLRAREAKFNALVAKMLVMEQGR
jgi:putative chitinase